MITYLLQLLGVCSFTFVSFIMCLVYGQFITTDLHGVLYGVLMSGVITILFYLGVLDPFKYVFYIYGVLSIFATPFIIKLFI